MDNKKNVLLAVVLCVGILIVWQRLFPPPTPTQPPVAAEQPGRASTMAAPREEQSKPASEPGTGDVGARGESPAEGVTGETGDGATAPRKRGPEQTVILRSRDARYELSTWGATLKRAELLGEKFTHEGKQVEIIRTDDANMAPFLLSFPKSDFEWPADGAWEVFEQSRNHVTFRSETAQVRVSKRYTLRDERYRIRLEVTIENRADREIKHNLVLHVFGRQDPEHAGSGFFTYATASLAEMVCHVGGKIERTGLENLNKEAVDKEGMVRWAAADERFFTIAAVPFEQGPEGLRKCGQRAHGPGLGEVFLAMAQRKIQPGVTEGYPFDLFVGPKYLIDLAGVTVPRGAGTGDAGAAQAAQGAATGSGAPAELDQVVNVTFAFLSRPLLALLKLFFKVTGNWGLAIIILTFLVRLVTFYPAHKQLLSGKKMARLAPKLAELRKKYGEDRQRMGAETMNLYKAHGVNPLGGCLPALIQMPIWIALFSTLSYSVELYHSAFALHIDDLARPDRYFIAPLIMGGVMSLQMRMSPAGADPQQQKMMAIMMPIMFTGFQLFLPSGLAIYTLTSYLLGILHQLLVNHLDRKYGGPMPALATAGPSPQPPFGASPGKKKLKSKA